MEENLTVRQWLVQLEAKIDSRDERMNTKIDQVERTLKTDMKEMRDEQRKQGQTIYGVRGDNGLLGDVNKIKDNQPLVGMVSTKVAVAAVIGVATVVATLVLGLA